MADNKVKIIVEADVTKASAKLREFGSNLSDIGGKISAAFTIPIAGAFAAAVANSKELQDALKPIQDAFKGIASELGTALVPMVKELTPYITQLAKDITILIKQFEVLPKWQKDVVMGFVGFLAIIGPVIFTIGQIINSIGTIGLLAPGFIANIANMTKGLWALAAPAAPIIALAGALLLLWYVVQKFGPDAWKTIQMTGALIARPLMGNDQQWLQRVNEMGINQAPSPAAPTSNAGGVTVNVTSLLTTADQDQMRRTMQPIINDALRQAGYR